MIYGIYYILLLFNLISIQLELGHSPSSLTKLCSSHNCIVTKDFVAAVLFR